MGDFDASLVGRNLWLRSDEPAGISARFTENGDDVRLLIVGGIVKLQGNISSLESPNFISGFEFGGGKVTFFSGTTKRGTLQHTNTADRTYTFRDESFIVGSLGEFHIPLVHSATAIAI